MKLRRLFSILPPLALAASLAAAQSPALVPVGGEIRVNTTTAESQSSPDVAMDDAGNFVVVWSGGPFLGNLEIFAQRYDASGTPLGSELQVNTFTSTSQSNPRVGMDADGGFVVVWMSENQFPPAIFSVIGQRYDNTGAPVGSEFHISTGLTTIFPDVAMGANGEFLVVWTGRPAGTFAPDDAYARLYDSAGNPSSSAFAVNAMPLPFFSFPEPAVTAAPDGSWVVAWKASSFSGFSSDIVARRLDTDGNPVGSEVVVQVPSDAPRQDANVAASSDRIVVSWTDNTGDRSARARLFDDGFSPLTGDLQLSTLPMQPIQESAVAMDGAGRFVTAWVERDLEDDDDNVLSPTRDGSAASILARVFDAAGNPLGSDFVVNTTTEGFQAQPRLAMSPAGHLVATWIGPDTGFENDVFAQVYVPAVQNAAPEARCRNLTVPAGLSCTANASIDNGSFDPDGADTITLAQSPAGPYALGATGVTLTVTDNHGAASSCTGTVTVVDATPPAISCPASITANGNLGSNGAVVPFTVSATDSCDASVGVVAVPAAGSLFPFGTTTVSVTATDDVGNNASCSFTVTVLSPRNKVELLIAQVDALGLAPKIENDLVKELEKALRELQKPDPNTGKAIKDLEKFIQDVQKERGAGISIAAADALIADAGQIIAQLGG